MTRKIFVNSLRLVVLTLICFLLMRSLKSGIEAFIFQHHPYHIQITYYGKDSLDPRIIYQHKVDRLSLDYAKDWKLRRLQDAPFVSRLEGVFRVTEDDKYTFEIGCDEHAILYLDNVPLVDNQKALEIGKNHMGTATNLNVGTYVMRLEHYHRKGNAWIRVKWKRDRSRSKVLCVPDIRPL